MHASSTIRSGASTITRICSESTRCESRMVRPLRTRRTLPSSVRSVKTASGEVSRRIASTESIRRSFPWPRMATRSHTSSISCSRWLLRKTVFPWLLSRPRISRISAQADGIDAVGRLVENQKLRIVEHGLRSPRLLHAFRIFADESPSPLPEPDHFQQFRPTPTDIRHRHVAQPAVILESCVAGEMVRNAVVLGEITDLTPRFDIASRSAQKLGIAPGLVDQPQEDFDESRLAGGVGTQEAEDFPPGDAERDTGQRGDSGGRTNRRGRSSTGCESRWQANRSWRSRRIVPL